MQPIIPLEMPYAERLTLMKQITGGMWKHEKTGKVVEILGRVGYSTLTLKHASGRVTKKEDHYFVGEYYTYTE